MGAPPAGQTAEPPPVNTESRPMPADPYREWDGGAGVPDWGDPRLRQIVVDNAELAEDQEVRDAATAALSAGGTAAIMEFLDRGLPAAKARAADRKATEARKDLAAVQALRGTGGPYFNAEVERVLAGSDSDRKLFLAYGGDVARQRDDQATQSAQDAAAANRAKLQALLAVAGPEVKRAAQTALDAGDAEVTEFFKTGYLVAAKADAEVREQFLRDQEAREKAAEELSELARKAARAAQARRLLLEAHGNGVRALEESSNALISAGTQARRAAQILAANAAGGQHPPNAFDEVKAEVARQLGYARRAATDAQAASASAQVQAAVLVDTGLTYGVQWAQMASAMADAARAAVSASETAQHAIDATAFTDQARDAQEKTERHAEEAKKWRLHAEEHARTAAQIAEAARVQAEAAKDAALRTKTARHAAEAAEARAWQAAERTRNARITAEREAANAAAARAVAERERAAAASARGRAEQQAAVAKGARREADRQAGIAAEARRGAVAADGLAATAETNAKTEESLAAESRDKAYAAERDQRAADARAAALDATAAAARGGPHADTAQNAANQARLDANTARGAAGAARNSANVATGAAAGARAAATEATRHAARARAAAQQAAAAAARANAAANKAEAEAAATHLAVMQANAAASDATFNETKAAEAARAAQALAQQAASEAMNALWSAQRTKAEADAAAAESVSAATQAGLAVQAATAARSSSKAITDPANTAITVAAPFSGADLDADFVILVANQAKAVGAEQAAVAQQRATEALTAARLAQEAADRAAGEVKPAFDAAAAAARSSAAAAKSAAEAQQAAADAAADGAAARTAAARANDADAQAREDARKARAAANAANNDAAIAGRNAVAAERDATAARAAASRAETDAAAARDAAGRAEADAETAEKAAQSAQTHADNAAEAARNALASAIEAGKAADRAEEAQRQRENAQRAEKAGNVEAGLPGLTSEEAETLDDLCEGNADCLAQYEQARGDANKTILQFLKENGADVLLEIIGVNDAKKCFGEGDIAACLWTFINAASLAALIVKLPQLGAAMVRVGISLDRFLTASSAGVKAVGAAQVTLNAVKACLTGKPNSFAPETQVLLADGSRKPIRSVVIGDSVVATDTKSVRTEPHTVTDVIVGRGVKDLVEIGIDGSTDRVVATDRHPFWAPGRGQWINAGDLTPGETLRDATGGVHRVSSTRAWTEVLEVYNLTVDEVHTFYVFSGGTSLLAHNSSACEELVERAAEIAEAAAKEPQKIFIKDKHLINDTRNFVKFNVGTVDEARALVVEGLNKSGIVFRKQKDDRFLAFADMGREIGENGRSIIKMVVGKDGNVITAYPVHSIPPA
ncbi:polymorphic toxin-type HINT domain-containing protein [Amycolatopsis sp. cmx-11-12]|uniref:polymorphic toxin-type HINT domain-containing protein n=1 Tax=Amycolatopsis sp. cmx-11-12 TaxID=2785795 RepID=UPI0039180C8F